MPHRLSALLLFTCLIIGCDDAADPDAVGDMALVEDMAPTADAMADAGPRPNTGSAQDAALLSDAIVDPVADAGPPPTWLPPEARGLCAGDYSRAMPTGELAPGLEEISGLATSGHTAGVLWAHNDSGDGATLYALDETGAPLATVQLEGVDAVDFEDLAAAPCPDGSGPCLWVADIGDNPANRDGDARVRPHLYIAPEPELDPAPEVIAPLWRITLAYPDGPLDAEALAVAPDGQRFALIEKIDGASAEVLIGEIPVAMEGVAPLEVAGELPSPGVAVELGRMITAADLHPTGERLLVRVYTGTFEAELAEGFDSLLAPEALVFDQVSLGPLSERQGEAVTYDGLGTGVWTASETTGGEPQPLNRYLCR